MPDSRESYVWPWLDDGAMLHVLSGFSREDFTNAALADMRLQIEAEDRSRFILPHSKNPTLPALRNRLVHLVTDLANKACGRSTEQTQTMLFDRLAQPVPAALLLAQRLAGSPASTNDPGAPLDGARLALITGLDAEATSGWVANLVQRGRDAHVLAALHPKTKESLTFIRASDDDGLNATLTGLQARLRPDSKIHLFTATQLDGLTFWSELHAPKLPSTTIAKLAAIAARALPNTAADLALIRTDTGPVLLQISALNAAPAAADAFADHAPLQDIDLRVFTIAEHKGALAALQAHIAKPDFPIGYRVSLQPMRKLGPADHDVDQLLERIEDLQDILDQIRNLDAPSLRLLRFSDDQLPALIDGLRRLPPRQLQSEHLRYAAGHAAGRDGPAHFILYDPSHINLDIPEAYWRQQGDQKPISYWLDPNIAGAELSRRGRFSVFTPMGMMLVPSLADFGGTLDESLKIVLGGLFVNTAKIVETATARPMFLFSHPTEDGFALDVEVLDEVAFGPLQLNIRMLNDYLKLRGPNLVNSTDLAEVAANLYTGQLAKGLQDSVAKVQADAEESWDYALGEVERDATWVLHALHREIEDAQTRITSAESYLHHAATRMVSLEKLVEQAEKVLGGTEDVSALLNEKLDGLTDRRDEFVERALGEFTTADLAMRAADERMEELLAKLAALLSPE